MLSVRMMLLLSGLPRVRAKKNKKRKGSLTPKAHAASEKSVSHILDRARADGDEHVRQVEKEVAAHDRPLHLAVGLVALNVQGHPLQRTDTRKKKENEMNAKARSTSWGNGSCFPCM